MGARLDAGDDILRTLAARFGPRLLAEQHSADAMPTVWIASADAPELLRFLKHDARPRYPMLFDLTAIDERVRQHREGQPAADFTLVYQLLSPERNADIRIKVPLAGEHPSAPSITALWTAANWYEREVWDLFGIRFDGHPHLARLVLPPTWEGHPLRKEHPARATELGTFSLPDERQAREEEALRFRPEDWGMARGADGTEFMFLNLGPNHPSVHGVFRIVLQLDGEEIVDAVPDIGYHHRGAEKMAERQSWHTFIPYTDRIDYLGGVMNNLPYVLAVEKLAGIRVPERVEVMRVMTVELFRLLNHLLFYGTFVQDVGQLSPVFFMFTDRQRIYDVVEGVCGGRMHPSWFRIGGVAQDLPRGWEKPLRELLDYLAGRLDEYDRLALGNAIVRDRARGIGDYTADEAFEWGVTGPGLRACGVAWDLRKTRPYSGYERFDFEVPTGSHGDAYDRCVVHVEEMRQSLRIIRQCVDNMPAGPYKADHPLTTPPPKPRTLHDIETLIHHFLGVSWGPVIPPGEAFAAVEATKGVNGYYLVSDGDTLSYRTRIRTPSFAHLQMIPLIARGLMIPDLIAILGSIDFVMADVDR
ncbi:MAG TPA: NADH-quinone oxidoreductase subunit C/D [Rhodocyclaceae bacterium]|nr:NADH-quinone oxidoreductase subunit C/D [Rhodocyclaceae bacterium]